jgi:hypothetical protein
VQGADSDPAVAHDLVVGTVAPEKRASDQASVVRSGSNFPAMLNFLWQIKD